ncbi:MAG: hypothetical protein H3C55_08250 [Pseudorhodoplanes sp.]|nr:hypothetical protein [Pseudorhodoplanes sp.]
MTILKTSFLAAALATGLVASAGAITLQSTDGPREHGAPPQAHEAQPWMNDGYGAYASTLPAPRQYQGVPIEHYSPRVDIQ